MISAKLLKESASVSPKLVFLLENFEVDTKWDPKKSFIASFLRWLEFYLVLTRFNTDELARH